VVRDELVPVVAFYGTLGVIAGLVSGSVGWNVFVAVLSCVARQLC
jgi:hypothetical protein